MSVARILREETVGETRWAALDAGGEPVALYLERETNPVRLGAQFEARIEAVEVGAGGMFAELDGAGAAFIRRTPQTPAFAEGARVRVEILAEARGGKLPRAQIVAAGIGPGPSGAAAWRTGLKGGADAPVEAALPGDPRLQAAFEDALLPDVTLPGGGRLRIERTRALTAADIDTAGRAQRGSAAARALSINREAAQALARQILLRGLGGLFVLDCIAPITREAGPSIRDTFQAAWAEHSSRPAKALTPSQLGLMEASSGWWISPLSEHIYDETSGLRPETIALDGLRQLEREAQQTRLGPLTLALPEAVHRWLAAQHPDADVRLAAKYGARLNIRAHTGAAAEVRREA
ncbi:ribonuclease E/G [Hyphomonas sp.]|uniref:ribonuclease E/G n=1 Tax=Hyphomonas sp. TaxID=87 RepID=UPI00391BDB98